MNHQSVGVMGEMRIKTDLDFADDCDMTLPMKTMVRITFTLAVYSLLIFALYTRVSDYYDHEEVGLYGSLLCYSCIGVE
ncbi:MAG: hypothetical protein JXD19_05755 [Deltaproteobacteria bacterium]|nr:hypothetical protein [Deltaproteobacteria bacterium]